MPFKSRALLFAVVLSPLQFAFGQGQATGPTFTFGPPATPVYDISSGYQITNHVQGATIQPVDVVFQNIGLGVDAHGHLAGAGTMVVLVGNDPVAGDYTLSGKISGGGTKTRVNFSVHCKGLGVVTSIITSYNVSANYNLVINPAGTNMVGTVKGSAHFSDLGSGKINSALTLPLPPGVDGGWNVTLDVLPFVKLAGTGLIVVDNAPPPIVGIPPGTTLATKLTGTVSKSGVTKVKLSGLGNSAGTMLTLNLPSPIQTSNQLATVKGKILGQTVSN